MQLIHTFNSASMISDLSVCVTIKLWNVLKDIKEWAIGHLHITEHLYSTFEVFLEKLGKHLALIKLLLASVDQRYRT